MKIYPRPLFLGVSIAIAGCAIQPVPMSEQELAELSASDLSTIRNIIPPVTAPLTLEEVVARTLKYNLDYRTKLLEQALALGQLDVGKFDMLPRLMATAGYDLRDKDSVRNSTDSVTGATLYSNSISSEKQHFTGSLGLTWSLLDFGVSYYNAKQYADRALIMGERRRKVMHNLVEKTRSAFWRTFAAQKLEKQVEMAIKDAELALKDSRRIERERIKSPLEALRYQRNLLENLRLLEGVSRELAQSRIELNGLLGIPQGTTVTLIKPKDIEFNIDNTPVERMEEIAMLNNADLREQFYNVRIAITEMRRAIAKLFPGITFGYGYHYDSDQYLVNQQWMNAGVDIGFNLLNLLVAPSQMRLAETTVKLEEIRRLALRMSVLTQLHLARFQYHDAARQYLRAVEITEVDDRLAKLARSQEQSQMAGALERIAANVTYILSAVRQYYAMSKKHEALSKLKTSLGVEPRGENIDSFDLQELTARVKEFLESDKIFEKVEQPSITQDSQPSSANPPPAIDNNSAAETPQKIETPQKSQPESRAPKAKPRKRPVVRPTKIAPKVNPPAPQPTSDTQQTNNPKP